MRDVLFSHQDSIFLTHRLARSVYYDRVPLPEPPWPYAVSYSFSEGRLIAVVPRGEPGAALKEEFLEERGTRTLEVWLTGEEFDRHLPSPHNRSDTACYEDGTGEE